MNATRDSARHETLLTGPLLGQAVNEDLHVCDPVKLRLEHRLHAGQQCLHTRKPLGISLSRWCAVAIAGAGGEIA